MFRSADDILAEEQDQLREDLHPEENNGEPGHIVPPVPGVGVVERKRCAACALEKQVRAEELGDERCG